MPKAHVSLWSFSCCYGAKGQSPLNSKAYKRVRAILPLAVQLRRTRPTLPKSHLLFLSPNGRKCLSQTLVLAQQSTVVHYRGLTRVKCHVQEEDRPIVSVAVAMA
jgi:hypothetical protein